MSIKKGLQSILIIIIFFIASCSNDDATTNDTNNSIDTLIENIDLAEQLGMDSGEVKMFTMPTPLQMATVLKIMEVDYHENLLLKHDNIGIESDVNLSILLGMYLTDLGYTTVYNNTQKSLTYAKDIQFIMEELPIAFYVNDGFRKRFKNNIEHQDSLCKIILEGYNEANQYITETQNEGLGLLILTGAYIEGLYLVSSSNVSKTWLDEHSNILIQQKLFLDNFLALLSGYTSNKEISVVFNHLNQLKKAFDEIEITYNDEKDSYELKEPITPATRTKINQQVVSLRTAIINK